MSSSCLLTRGSNLQDDQSNMIDSHQHVFWHGQDDAGLISDMNKCGILTAWLLGWEIAPWEDAVRFAGALNPVHMRANGTHPGIPLEDLILARKNFPGRFEIGFCPHPMIGYPVARLEAAVKMFGIRVCGEWKFRMPFDDPRCIELFHAAGRLKLPVILHLDVPYLKGGAGIPVYQPNWYGGTVENLSRALATCPETIFVGHAPGFWREISADADDAPEVYPTGPVIPGGKLESLLATYPNLYADLSAGSALKALQRDLAYTRHFLIRFADKLLFGRDYYGDELQCFLQSLDLPKNVLHNLTVGNAVRLVPLDNTQS